MDFSAEGILARMKAALKNEDTKMEGGFLLNFRNAAGYADRNTGLTEGSLTQSLLDKILHHFLSYGIVGDNTLT